MIFTLNFHEFLHTVYKYMLNSVVEISVMFAKYFEYYTIILRGAVFSWTRCSEYRLSSQTRGSTGQWIMVVMGLRIWMGHVGRGPIPVTQ